MGSARAVCRLAFACSVKALVLLLLPLSALAAAEEVVLEGVVRLDVVRVKSTAVKVLVDGGERVAFVRPNGYFALPVTPGSHVVQAAAIGATFPQVRVEVSAKHRGSFKATTIAHDGSVLGVAVDELTIAPLAAEDYYEKRQPLSVWSFLKSPMGMMVAFMLVALVIMPYLTEGIDPEEMKKVQEQMRSQTGGAQQSLASLLGGAR